MSQTDLKPTTGVRLPLYSVIPVLIAVASAGMTWGVLNSDIKHSEARMQRIELSQQALEGGTDQKIQKLEAKLDKTIEANTRMMEVLGRIDERTSTLVRRIENPK